MCNGKFLIELIDDSALFAGLFILLGVCLHAWSVVSTMPSRALVPPASREDAFAPSTEGEAGAHIKRQRSTGASTVSAVAGADAVADAVAGAGADADADAGAPSAGKVPPPATYEAMANRVAELEDQVMRLIAREGRDQGLLGGKKKGRRALVPSSKSLPRFNRQARKAKQEVASAAAPASGTVSL